MSLRPEQRRFGMVFQHYALFPHLDVGQNVAFGLESLGVKGAEVSRRVAESLALVDLAGFEARGRWWAVRWTATAGRPGPGARTRAPSVAARRTAFQSGSGAPRTHPTRTSVVNTSDRDHHGHRHPRAGGCLRSRRRGGGTAPGAPRAGWHPGGHSIASLGLRSLVAFIGRSSWLNGVVAEKGSIRVEGDRIWRFGGSEAAPGRETRFGYWCGRRRLRFSATESAGLSATVTDRRFAGASTFYLVTTRERRQY